MEEDLGRSEEGRVSVESQNLILLSCGICFVCLISDVLMALRLDVPTASAINNVDVGVGDSGE